MKVKKQSEQIQFINGLFTRPEASEILFDIIGSAISFCSIQQMREWEKNHSADLSAYDKLKKELKAQRVEIDGLLNKVATKDQVKIKLLFNLEIDNK